jgi:Glycosyltransferase
MPHVLIEAAACGLPVIAPHIGAIGELIDDKTGWLVKDSGNCSGYVEAIRDVLANPREAQQRASRLKALINERHTWSAFLTRVEKLDIWQT